MTKQIVVATSALACAAALLVSSWPAPAVRKPVASPRIDAPAIAQRVMRAFRPQGSGFQSMSPRLHVSVADGAFTVASAAAPTRFWTRDVRRGERSLTRAATARLDGSGGLDLLRGEVREHLVHDERGLEQTWAFEHAPGGEGPLTVAVGAEGAYEGTTARGFHFGALTYGHATWVDAAGQRTAIEGRWTGDGVRFVVPEDVLAHSRFPAVLDPLISAEFDVDAPVPAAALLEQQAPAIAWGGSQYLLAWTSVSRYTSTPDVVVARLDAAGALLDPFGLTLSIGADEVTGVAVASDGAGFLVAWSETRGSFRALKAVRLSAAGTVLDAAPLVLIDNVASISVPRAAFAASTYLVVWDDARDGDRDIYANRVNPTTGAILDGLGFVVCNAANEQSFPVVDSTGTEFMVAWQDGRNGAGDDVYAARVTTSGSVLDPNGFVVSSVAGAQAELSLTWNGGTHLLTWADYRSFVRYEIYGALITATGSVLPNTTTNIPIATGGSPRSTPSATALGSHPSGAPFIVTWVDLRNGAADLYGARISDGGALLDATHLWLVDAGNAQYSPAVAWSGASAFVAWADRRSATSSIDIWGETVTSAGTVGPASLKSFSGSDEWEPSVASNGALYLVVWSDLRSVTGFGAPNAIYGARVSDAGVMLDPSGILISAAPGASPRSPDVTWVSQANQFMVAWTDDRDGGHNIYGARVTPAGANLDPNGVIVSSATGRQTEPAIASDGTKALVTWTDTRNASNGNDVYGAFLLPDAGVSPNANVGLAMVSTLLEQDQPAAAFNGTDYLVAWTDHRPLSPNGEDIMVARVTPAGTVRDAFGVSITGAGNQTMPAVAAAGSTFLVAWQQPGATSDNDIAAMRLNAAGTSIVRLDPDGGVGIATGVASQNFPAVTSDGTGFLVAWQSAVAGAFNDTRAARVSASSSQVLDSPSLLLSSGRMGQGAIMPRLASGGPRSFLAVSWTSLHYGQRVVARLVGNTPPVPAPLSITLNEDNPTSILLSGSDADGDVPTLVVQAGPTNGTLSGTPPTVTYTPTTNYSGPDSFTYAAFDGVATSGAATVSITVQPINDAPTAQPQVRSTAEDTPLAITLSATDPEGSALTYAIFSAPTNGSLTINGPNVVYTPATNFSGTDSFSFKAADSALAESGPVQVSITVTAVNDAPVATAQSPSTPEDTPRAIVLAATDVDSTTLTYATVTPPTNGTLSGAPPNLVYTPALNFNGTDSFTFRANDGALDSAPAQVQVSVTPMNDPPVAQPQTLSTPQGTAVNVLLTGTDLDGNALTFSVVTQPGNGTLTGTPPSLTYTPNPQFRGNDTFSFKANDGQADSVPAAVGISVAAVNRAPVATPQMLTTPEDTLLDLTLAGTDQDGDALTFVVVVQPTHGTLAISGAAVTYTPAPNYAGPDEFRFRANDGTSDSTEAAVRLTVSPVDDPPVAQAQTVTTSEDTPVSIVLGGSDVDGTTPTFALVMMPAHGTLSGNPPNLNYTPEENYAGPDELMFSASDGTSSVTATVSLVITAVNDAPVVEALQASTAEGTPVSLTLKGSDLEGSALSFVIGTPPEHGELSGTAPELTYTPQAGFTGTDTFTFTASDGAASSAAATASITVTPSTGSTRDTTQVNGWSCGCSTGGGAGQVWLLGLGLLVLASRRRGALPAVVLACAITASGTSQAAPSKPAKTGKSSRKEAPKPAPPAPEPTPAPTPAPPPVVAEPPPAPKQRSVSALNVSVSVPNEKLDEVAFSEMLTSAVDDSKLFRVISAREVATMLGMERQRQLLGCTDDTSCFTEIADALGTDFVIQGTVGKVGDTYLVTVRLIESKKARVVGRGSNQTKDANLLLNLVWKSAQQALDAWGTTLPPEEAQKVAARPQVEPAVAVAAPTSRIGVMASAVGSYQPLAAEGSRASIGGEVAATWRLGRFDLGAGVVISPTPGGRLFVTFALLTGDNRVAVGLRGTGFPTATTYGGGPIVEYERALGKIFALRAHVASEAYASPNGLVVAVLGGLGAAARF